MISASLPVLSVTLSHCERKRGQMEHTHTRTHTQVLFNRLHKQSGVSLKCSYRLKAAEAAHPPLTHTHTHIPQGWFSLTCCIKHKQQQHFSTQTHWLRHSRGHKNPFMWTRRPSAGEELKQRPPDKSCCLCAWWRQPSAVSANKEEGRRTISISSSSSKLE